MNNWLMLVIGVFFVLLDILANFLSPATTMQLLITLSLLCSLPGGVIGFIVVKQIEGAVAGTLGSLVLGALLGVLIHISQEQAQFLHALGDHISAMLLEHWLLIIGIAIGGSDFAFTFFKRG